MLFAELDDRELASIAAVAKTRRYAKDDAVFHADEIGDVFYLIREGQVKVTMISPEGKEIILSILAAGDFFGEMALFDNEPRSATVIAIEPLEVVSIWRTDFLHILSETAAQRLEPHRVARHDGRLRTSGALLPRPRAAERQSARQRLRRRDPPDASGHREHDRDVA
jgi:CRP/FNR family transcriptional regulator/CRP/FNR family cyclic AMP-dependent transcriptional regulator